jgi:hypothetical protein
MKNLQYLALGILAGYLMPHLITLMKNKIATPEKEASYSYSPDY